VYALALEGPKLVGRPAAANAKAEIAAMPRQIQRELGKITAVDSKGDVRSIQRAIEEFLTVEDRKAAILGDISQGSIQVGFK
jgi:hypothetical protein